MRIMLVITSLGYGGAERIVTNLAIALKTNQHDVHIVSLTDFVPLAVEAESNGVRVTTLGFDGTIYAFSKLYVAAKKLRKLISDWRPDLLHSHIYLADILVRLAAPSGAVLFSTLHGTDSWWGQGQRIRSRLKTWLDSYLAKLRQVKLVAVSDSVRRVALSVYGKRESEIPVVWNGIEPSVYGEQRRTRAGRLNVVQVGRFYSEKGHETSILALKELMDSELDLQLVFVGDGPLRDALRHQAERLGVAERVTFAGAQHDVQRYLLEADIFWMPSISEGFGMACVEAMAVGLPVIASDVGGLPDLVSKECGYLVRVGDYRGLAACTRTMARDPEGRYAMGAAGRSRVEEMFSLKAMLHAYESLYRASVRQEG